MNEVQAVKNRDEIVMIERLLRKHGGEMYGDVWVFGVNTALRIGDLLSIRMADVVGRESFTLVEEKTGKRREVSLNGKARAIVERRARVNPGDEWLFQAKGNRAKSLSKPVSRETVARKFKEIGEILGIDLGTHSMRKTRGAVMYAEGIPIETVCKVLNHSSPAVTMRYIGLDRATVAKTYADFEL